MQNYGINFPDFIKKMKFVSEFNLPTEFICVNEERSHSFYHQNNTKCYKNYFSIQIKSEGEIIQVHKQCLKDEDEDIESDHSIDITPEDLSNNETPAESSSLIGGIDRLPQTQNQPHIDNAEVDTDESLPDIELYRNNDNDVRLQEVEIQPHIDNPDVDRDESPYREPNINNADDDSDVSLQDMEIQPHLHNDDNNAGPDIENQPDAENDNVNPEGNHAQQEIDDHNEINNDNLIDINDENLPDSDGEINIEYTQAERKRINKYREPSALTSNEILKLTAMSKEQFVQYCNARRQFKLKGELRTQSQILVFFMHYRLGYIYCLAFKNKCITGAK